MNENFADPVDRAVVEQEKLLAENLRVARARMTDPAPYKGTCYNCGEPLPAPNRYCDEDCRDDFEKINRARSAQFRRLE